MKKQKTVIDHGEPWENQRWSKLLCRKWQRCPGDTMPTLNRDGERNAHAKCSGMDGFPYPYLTTHSLSLQVMSVILYACKQQKKSNCVPIRLRASCVPSLISEKPLNMWVENSFRNIFFSFRKFPLTNE